MMNQTLMKEKGAKNFYDILEIKKKLSGIEPVRGAFELAYRDTQRTMRGMGKNSNNKKIKEEIFEIVVEDFYKNYAENIQHYSIQDFDGKFALSCYNIIEVAKKYSFTQLYFGQAQQIVNMFFKYIALVDDRLNLHLNYLHVALNNTTLNGMKGLFNQTKIAELTDRCKPWSKLEDWETYYNIQKTLREQVSCPIMIDYNNWEKWKLNN